MPDQQEPMGALRNVIANAAAAFDDDELLAVFSSVYEERTGTALKASKQLPIPLESPNQVSPGDKVLWNDRKKPATVEEVTQEDVTIRGPQGGKGAASRYWFTFDADDGVPRCHYGTSASEGHTPTSSRANNLQIVERGNHSESQ